MGKGFRIGNVFSEGLLQTLSAKQEAAKDRALRAQIANAQNAPRTTTRTVTREGESDEFMLAQLRAQQMEKDRELKREIAQMGLSGEQAERLYRQKQMELDRAMKFDMQRIGIESDEADRMFKEEQGRLGREQQQSQFDATMGQRKSEAEAEAEYKRGVLADKSEKVGLERERNLYKMLAELGGKVGVDENGVPYVVGSEGKPITSKSDKRGSDIARNEALNELTAEQKKKLTAEIEGTLPEIKDKQRRTKAIEDGIWIRAKALQMRMKSDADALALDVYEMFADPAYGGFGNPENFENVRKQAESIYSMLQTEGGKAQAEAFWSAYEERSQEVMEGERAKQHAANAADRTKKEGKPEEQAKPQGDSLIDTLFGAGPGK